MTLKPRSQSSDRKKLWLLLLPVIVLTMIYSRLPGEQQSEVGISLDSQDQKSSEPLFSFESSSSEEASGTSSTPLYYPYSVIKGGVRDAEELKKAIQKDPVVAEHYSDFNLANAKTVSLLSERFAYVSYRIKNQVYWTKRKLKLAKGETVLTDGKNYARGRCGNRITEVSQANTSPHEPKPQVFDTPIKQETTVPLRMAYSPQAGSPQLVTGLSLTNGEASSDYASTTLGGQASGGAGFYGGGAAGFVGGFVPGSGVGGGGGSPGGAGSGTGLVFGPEGSPPPDGGGKSYGPIGGSGDSGSHGGVIGSGDSGNQGNGQGSTGGSSPGSSSSTPTVTSNENGSPDTPPSGTGSPVNNSSQGGSDSSTSGPSTPPTSNGGNTFGGSSGPTSHIPGSGGDNPSNSEDIHPPGHPDTLPPPRAFTQPSDTKENGSNSNGLISPNSPSPVQVPEPSTLVLMVYGLSGYLTLKKFSKKNPS